MTIMTEPLAHSAPCASFRTRKVLDIGPVSRTVDPGLRNASKDLGALLSANPVRLCPLSPLFVGTVIEVTGVRVGAWKHRRLSAPRH